MIGSHLGWLKFQTLEQGHMEEVIEDLAGNKVYKNSGIDTFSAPNKECHKYFRGTTFSATMGSVRRVLNCLTAGL
ncbi:hypothetical protein EJB05_47100, partial [Eragrostis curvula]